MRHRIMMGILVLFISCSNRTGIPGDIIPPDSMQVIMKDIVIASQYSVLSVSKDSLIKDKLQANQDLMQEVFVLHHINRESFKKSLLFYETRPDLNKRIFDSLSAFANRQQKDLYRPRPPIKPHILPHK